MCVCVCARVWVGGWGSLMASGSRIVRAVRAGCRADTLVPPFTPAPPPRPAPPNATRRHDAHGLTLFCIICLLSSSSLARHSSLYLRTLSHTPFLFLNDGPTHTHTHTHTHTQPNFVSLTPVSSITRPSLSPTKSGTPTHFISLCEQCVCTCVCTVCICIECAGCAAACNQGAQGAQSVRVNRVYRVYCAYRVCTEYIV